MRIIKTKIYINKIKEVRLDYIERPNKSIFVAVDSINYCADINQNFKNFIKSIGLIKYLKDNNFKLNLRI